MKKHDWQKVKELFQQAVELPEEHREAFLTSRCSNPELRSAVKEMLVSHSTSTEFLESPDLDFTPLLQFDSEGKDPLIGHPIGSYRIEELIGEGGMGIVYLAARDDNAFDRKVAIKLIRQGMLNDSIMKRFHLERKTLAALDHPNIARLLDGGNTNGGVPFFVMEYVDGLPLGDYCDANRLSIHDRLKLFLKVCSAVSYAHQNLVIHRDLKPGNILVTSDGEPKLLDFGVAKLLGSNQATGVTLPTGIGSPFITLDYCSPEQIKQEQITTSSDVYSLGAILYNLLTGSRVHQFKSHSLEEIGRVICEQLPRHSSAIFANPAPGAAEHAQPDVEEISNHRNTTPQKLRQVLSGDLDDILMMALRKEPQRRYGSVNQLSEDIQRFLDGRPVIAHPESFGYLAARFISRHRSGVLAAAVIFLMFLGGVVAIIWQANVAAAERDRAQLEAEKTQRINEFFQDMLASANPRWFVSSEKKGTDVTVLDVLNEASEKIGSEMADQPEIKAELHTTIGETYQAIGKPDLAATHFEAAYTLRADLYREDDAKVIESLYFLAIAQSARADYEACERYLRKTIALIHGSGRTDNVYLAHALVSLNSLLVTYRNDPEAAEPVAREASRRLREFYGENHYVGAISEHCVAGVLTAKGELAAAEQIYLDILGRLQTLEGISDYDLDESTSVFLGLLGRIFYLRGEYEKAESRLRQSIALLETVKNPNPMPDASLNFDLGKVLLAKGEYAASQVCFEKVLRVYTTLADSAYAAAVRVHLGRCHFYQQQYAQSEKRLLRGYNVLAGLPDYNRQFEELIPLSLEYLIKMYEQTGRSAQAERYRLKQN